MSRYFQPMEFACQCGRATCNAAKVSESLLDRLDPLRAAVGQPLIVNSGVRCPYQNDKAGGIRDSEHVLGLGADIRCQDSTLRFKLLKAAILGGWTRIGVGETFIHLGISSQHDNFVVWHYYKKGEGH
jgi:zinc D-Ala-D-Ala carboxypeptidase